MRAIRSESVGKKSTQSTQSDQGVEADEGTSSRGHLQKQTTVEGGGVGIEEGGGREERKVKGRGGGRRERLKERVGKRK